MYDSWPQQEFPNINQTIVRLFKAHCFANKYNNVKCCTCAQLLYQWQPFTVLSPSVSAAGVRSVSASEKVTVADRE